MLPRLLSRSRLRTVAAAVAVASLLSLACHDNAIEPEFASVSARYQLRISGTGSKLGGVVTSQRGGISCTIAAGGAVSGKCEQGYKASTIVTLRFAPSAGAIPKVVGGSCPQSPETILACSIPMTQDAVVTINFDPQTNVATL